MTTITPGLHLSGKLSNEEYATAIMDDLDKISQLIAIGITKDLGYDENDTILRFSYNAVLDLYGRIGKRKERGGFKSE